MFSEAMDRETVTEGQIRQIQRYRNCIHLAGNLSHQLSFELPVMMGKEVVNLKMKLIEGQQDAATVKLQMSSKEYGTFDAMAVIKGTGLQGYMICDNRQVVDQIKAQESIMRQEIENLGIKVGELTITMNRKNKEFYRTDITEQPMGEKPSNQLLYQVAKIFIKYAKQTSN